MLVVADQEQKKEEKEKKEEATNINLTTLTWQAEKKIFPTRHFMWDSLMYKTQARDRLWARPYSELLTHIEKAALKPSFRMASV